VKQIRRVLGNFRQRMRQSCRACRTRYGAIDRGGWLFDFVHCGLPISPVQSRVRAWVRTAAAPARWLCGPGCGPNPHACGVAAIAFTLDKTVDAKPVNNKLLLLERINVLAGYDGNGWQNIPAMIQYAVVEGRGDVI
jgi:hypothetical protein